MVACAMSTENNDRLSPETLAALIKSQPGDPHAMGTGFVEDANGNIYHRSTGKRAKKKKAATK